MSTPSPESYSNSEAEYLKAVHLIETGETFFAESVEIFSDTQEELATELYDILKSGYLQADDEINLAAGVDDVVNAFSQCVDSINDDYKYEKEKDDSLIHPTNEEKEDMATRIRTLLQLTTEAVDKLSEVVAWIPNLTGKAQTPYVRRDVQLQIASIFMDSNSSSEVDTQDEEMRQQLVELLRNELVAETERILARLRGYSEPNTSVGVFEPQADIERTDCARWIESRRPNSLGRHCVYTAHTLE